MAERAIAYAKQTNVAVGLSDNELAERLHRFGENVGVPTSRLQAAYIRIRGTLAQSGCLLGWSGVLALAGVAAVTKSSLGPLFGVQCVLSVFGTIVCYRRHRATEQAVEDMTTEPVTKVNVLRSGSWANVPSSTLVPGDVIMLHIGTSVPADVLPADDSENITYTTPASGQTTLIAVAGKTVIPNQSVVSNGEGRAYVVNTGSNRSRGPGPDPVQPTIRLPPVWHTVQRFAGWTVAFSVVHGFILKVGDQIVNIKPEVLSCIFLAVVTTGKLFRSKFKAE